ncbi:hypothetical protein ES703_59024 [subsurface metagenome]
MAKLTSEWIESLPTFKELKQRGRFSAPDSWIEPGIRKLCKSLNKLPYVVTVGSCEGHTREEYIERGWDMDETPAHIQLYVLADRRFELWDWIKENIGMDKVEITLDPMFEPGSEMSKFIYRDENPTYVRDKLFNVQITSKSLRMPFKGDR